MRNGLSLVLAVPVARRPDRPRFRPRQALPSRGLPGPPNPPRRQKAARDAEKRVSVADGRNQSESIEPRQHEIGEDQARAEGARGAERLLAVGDGFNGIGGR